MSMSKYARGDDLFPEMTSQDPPIHPGTHEKHEAWCRVVRLWAKASKLGKSEPERVGPTVALACQGLAQLVVQRLLASGDGLDLLSEPKDVEASVGRTGQRIQSRWNSAHVCKGDDVFANSE